MSAAVLPPHQVREVVEDPDEQAYLHRLRPSLVPVWPEAIASREVVRRVAMADDPDEVLWHRISLALCLDEARAARPAPHEGARVGSAAEGPDRSRRPDVDHPGRGLPGGRGPTDPKCRGAREEARAAPAATGAVRARSGDTSPRRGHGRVTTGRGRPTPPPTSTRARGLRRWLRHDA